MFCFRHSLIRLVIFLYFFSPPPSFVFPEVQCPQLNVETHLRACSYALQSSEDFVHQAVILIFQGIRNPAVMVPAVMVSLLSFPELRFLLKQRFVGRSLCLCWITTEYGFALVLTELVFFSLLKHIAVYLFLICYAYKLLKLYVRSVVVPKLPGCVRPELPEGPSSMHSLSSAIPSIFFSSVCIYFSSFILTSGYKISTVLLF